MNVGATVAGPERARTPAERKRLGQYFTGTRVARLLATIAGARGAKTILDPMMGSGDMLCGAVAAGAMPQTLAGIDIDPDCIAMAANRQQTSGATLIRGDAFSPETIHALPEHKWELVITNPPYVRYQATSARGGINPSAVEVRAQLRHTIMECVEPADRAAYATLVDCYSGLADLAVPAWLLCAALVAPGGTLAMVVPDTWLSRDYATTVRYLLARFFDVDFVIRDGDAAWFEDALVRTSLLVARRVATRSSAFEPPPRGGYLEATLRRDAIDDRSVVGRIYPRAVDADKAFAGDLRRKRPTHQALRHGTAVWIPGSHSVDELKSLAAGSRWIDLLEPQAAAPPSAGPVVPVALKNALASQQQRFTTLAALGWKTGQGLRTGANVFFYCDLVWSGDDISRVRAGAALGGGELDVPNAALLPVLRSQAELPQGFAVSAAAIRGRLLGLWKYALPEDICRDPDLAPYRPLPDSAANLVRLAARTNVGSDTAPRFVPELTAVRTNVRPGSRNGTIRPARFWYQLPRMTERHQPDLFVARVNHGHPRFVANADATVIDANFSVLWRHEESGLADRHALLALLNSSWAQAALERSATVLGGGALKVEATHIRRMPIPVLDERTWEALSELGRDLMKSSQRRQAEVLQAINEHVLCGGLGLNPASACAIAEIARSARAARAA